MPYDPRNSHRIGAFDGHGLFSYGLPVVRVSSEVSTPGLQCQRNKFNRRRKRTSRRFGSYKDGPPALRSTGGPRYQLAVLPSRGPSFRQWERMVRSAKSALRVVLGHQTVPEEVLAIILREVESMINERP